MELRFSDDFLKVLELSRDEALRTGWYNITADHIMLGVLRMESSPACMALEALGADPCMFKEYLDESLFCPGQIPWEERDSIHPGEGAVSMLQHAALEARRCGSPAVEPMHYVLAICRMSGSYSHDWMDANGVTLRALVEASGLEWSHYGLNAQSDPDNDPPAPEPELLAAAIERRLREGYTTSNPHVS